MNLIGKILDNRYEILEKLYRNINNMLDLDLKNAMINEIERKKHIISPFIWHYVIYLYLNNI